MTNKTEMVSDADLDELEVAEVLLAQQGFSNLAGAIAVAYTFIKETRAAPPEDVRAVVDGPLTDEGTMVQVLEPQKQNLLQPHTLLPHPPRHWGFLQPEREVPGYTIEQMKEYGALCAAEALRQNK